MSNPLPQRIQQLYITWRKVTTTTKRRTLVTYKQLHRLSPLKMKSCGAKSGFRSNFRSLYCISNFSSLAADHSGKTKRFHDELALFTQRGTLSVLKSKAWKHAQSDASMRILVFNQITITETPVEQNSQWGFHLFYLVYRFGTKNTGCKEKQDNLNISITEYFKNWQDWECHLSGVGSLLCKLEN